ASHVTRQLTAYHHGEMSPSEKVRIETHLRACSECRAAYDEIRFGARLASTLSVSEAPASLWDELHRLPSAPTRRRWIPDVIVVSALAAVLLLAVLVTRTRISSGRAWEVSGMPGTPLLRPGEALETGSGEAQIKIADIGQMTIESNTKIRLL